MGAGGTPANEVVASIGSGKDYADIATWEAATDDDCVNGFGVGDYSDPCSPVGELYDEDYSEAITFSGATTDSTHYRRLSVAAGERHSGDFPKVDSGAKVTGVSVVSEDYFELEWMIVELNSTVTGIVVSGGQDVLLRLIICEMGTNGYDAFSLQPGNGTNPVAENCIGITRRGGSTAASTFVCGYQDGVKLRNCVGWAKNTVTRNAFGSYGNYTNCIGLAPNSAAFGDTSYGDWNVGSDTTAPGANSDQYDNTAAADLFEDTTDTAEDLHLKAAADGNYEGTDLSAYFTDDMDGDVRDDWDIGPDEYVVAPVGAIMNQINTQSINLGADLFDGALIA